ncbi:D-aspartate oxidase, partial [Plakobranchus ocellatus]
MAYQVAVVGAGAVGLSTALSIQQRFHNAKVTLIAERFDEGTTSWGAGGFFRLDLDDYPLEERDNLRQWGRESWKFYTDLARSEQAHDSGMAFVAGTLLLKTQKDSGYSLMSELTHDFLKFDETNIKKLNMPVSYNYGYSFTTVVTHVPSYLRWLMQSLDCVSECMCIKALMDINSNMEQLKMQLSNDFDVVVTCCGLKAAQLCNDESTFPVMGHIVKVKAPWFKKFFYCEDLYIIP